MTSANPAAPSYERSSSGARAQWRRSSSTVPRPSTRSTCDWRRSCTRAAADAVPRRARASRRRASDRSQGDEDRAVDHLVRDQREVVEYIAAASVRKPRYERKREPSIFLPAEVEQIRAKLDKLRDRTLVSVLAYSGPRPEEVFCRLAWSDVGEKAIRYVDTKRHRVRFTPLLAPFAEDLREWFLASGRPTGTTPVFPAHDGGFWGQDDGGTGGLRGPAARRKERDRGTCGRATSRCASMRQCPSRRSPRSRDERADDRAALRRRDRELGRPAGACRAANPRRSLS